MTSLAAYLLGIYYLSRAYEVSRYLMLAYLTVVGYGIVVELLDIRATHMYYYAELLVMFGERPDWVPLTIGVSWATVLVLGTRISDLTGLPWWQRPLMDGAIAASMDLMVDPVSSQTRWVDAVGDSCVGIGEPVGGLGVWTWCVPQGDLATWFDIPLQNTFAWFLIVASFSLLLRVSIRALQADERPWPVQIGILAGVATGSALLVATALEVYVTAFPGPWSQRLVVAGMLLSPVVLIVAQRRRLAFSNPIDIGLLAAPAWMFGAGLTTFFLYRIDSESWPASAVVIVLTSLASSALILTPFWGTIARWLSGELPIRTSPPDPPRTGKERVVILGGGVGAITTAMELTEPSVRDRYDVTIYQIGWRLGGKGASGRDLEADGRIEEHGIHLWAGLYDNAFRAARAAYAELGRTPGTPMASWRDAWKPIRARMAFMDWWQGDWTPWWLDQVTNDELPGEPDAHLLLPFWSYMSEGFQVIRRFFRQSQKASSHQRRRGRGPLMRMLLAIEHAVILVVIEAFGLALYAGYGVVSLVHRLIEPLTPPSVRHFFHAIMHTLGGVAVWILHWMVRAHWRAVRGHLRDDTTRKSWCMLNLGVGLLRGMHRDDVVSKGFETIDHLEFREWLSKHIVWDGLAGSSPYGPGDEPGQHSITLESPLALSLYNADFAFEDGDIAKPRISAGVAAYTLVRLALTWKGAVLWSMQSGMGDVVFAPYYEVLRSRGVNFRFFHKVKDLHVDEAGGSIASVSIARQAELVDEAAGYAPLVTVKDLPCWPSKPLWDQLKDGARYRDEKADFEAWFGPEVETFELQAGRDYDHLVLGISLGAHPYICRELIDANADWKAMVGNIARVRTQSMQLWFGQTPHDMGWPPGEGPSVSCYDASNFDVWYDMSQVLESEGWPTDPDLRPASLSYMNGAMKCRVPRLVPQTPEALDQATHNEQVRDLGRAFLETLSWRLFPKVATNGGFDWRALFGPPGEPPDEPARLGWQYTRANVQPTELYVQSLPGSAQYRLHPGDSGFDNLLLAGDWTWNAFNVGCVESATISGMLAAHAISGEPALDRIVGLTFGHPHTRYQQEGRQSR